jgi:hypothetical protein
MSDGMGRDESSSPRPHGDKGLQAARASTATSAQAVAAAAALNYSAFLNASVASHGDPSVMLNSTENLLRNIQGLLKVAAENARQQDRQANYEKGWFPFWLPVWSPHSDDFIFLNDIVV